MTAPILTHQAILQLLDYCPVSGVFTWRARPRNHFKNIQAYGAWNTRYAGKEAGGISGQGYSKISIYGYLYSAHRLAWLHVYGEFPSEEIDHINHDRSDNKLSNLREATHSQNGRNAKKRRDNTSGTTGVSWCKRENRWIASIKVDGKLKYGGYFINKDAAIARRKEMNAEHGYHKNHGNSIA